MRAARAGEGFTLVEVLVALVIIGVLLAVAFPSYQQSVRKGRRAEAFSALTQVQQAQERHRANRTSYAAGISPDESPADPDTIGRMPTTTANGRYRLVVSDAGPAGYTATATAQGAQAADGDCAVLAVRASGGRLWYGSGSGSVDWSDPAAADRGNCWAK